MPREPQHIAFTGNELALIAEMCRTMADHATHPADAMMAWGIFRRITAGGAHHFPEFKPVDYEYVADLAYERGHSDGSWETRERMIETAAKAGRDAGGT